MNLVIEYVYQPTVVCGYNISKKKRKFHKIRDSVFKCSLNQKNKILLCVCECHSLEQQNNNGVIACSELICSEGCFICTNCNKINTLKNHCSNIKKCDKLLCQHSVKCSKCNRSFCDECVIYVYCGDCSKNYMYCDKCGTDCVNCNLDNTSDEDSSDTLYIDDPYLWERLQR